MFIRKLVFFLLFLIIIRNCTDGATDDVTETDNLTVDVNSQSEIVENMSDLEIKTILRFVAVALKEKPTLACLKFLSIVINAFIINDIPLIQFYEELSEELMSYSYFQNLMKIPDEESSDSEVDPDFKFFEEPLTLFQEENPNVTVYTPAAGPNDESMPLPSVFLIKRKCTLFLPVELMRCRLRGHKIRNSRVFVKKPEEKFPASLKEPHVIMNTSTVGQRQKSNRKNKAKTTPVTSERPTILSTHVSPRKSRAKTTPIGKHVTSRKPRAITTPIGIPATKNDSVSEPVMEIAQRNFVPQELAGNLRPEIDPKLNDSVDSNKSDPTTTETEKIFNFGNYSSSSVFPYLDAAIAKVMKRFHIRYKNTYTEILNPAAIDKDDSWEPAVNETSKVVTTRKPDEPPGNN